ncbi:antiterminator Q family protein [Pseudomonas chlororaphis]|uniref:antiterminator Q family protein n=1 Tax=Pseudomonas chlororaphis TaxID=587753 RepID=UPI001677E0F6|nr:antiterminator Q family protein [Pseudomonas chlororaphis]
MIYDAEELLTQWGRWVWQGSGVPVYTSPSYALMRDNVEQLYLPAAAITDDEAMMIDRMIAVMGRRDEVMANCVRLYYCTNRTMEQVGKLMQLSRLKVRELLIAGKTYVEACLDMRAAA